MKIRIDRREIRVEPGVTVAAAIAAAGTRGFAPLCAMGVCHQCHATIDGVAHCRSCLILCRDGMEVRTGGQ